MAGKLPIHTSFLLNSVITLKLASFFESIGDGNEDMNKSNDDMDGASALAALASAAVAGENGKENNENAANKETNSSASNGTSTNNAQDQASKRDANWFDVGIIKGTIFQK